VKILNSWGKRGSREIAQLNIKAAIMSLLEKNIRENLHY
jgi:hypothetical protein